MILKGSEMKTLASTSLIVLLLLLQSCSKGDTSVDSRPETDGPVPSNFVGTYIGTLTATAKSGVLKRSTTDTVTITVSSDNTLRFQGDDPEEIFVTTVGANGNFNGSLPFDIDDCSGTIKVSGNVDGSVATGELGGSGKCKSVSVGVSGNFNAAKQ